MEIRWQARSIFMNCASIVPQFERRGYGVPPKYRIGFFPKILKVIVPGPPKLGSCLPMLAKKFLLKHNIVAYARRRSSWALESREREEKRTDVHTTQSLPSSHTHIAEEVDSAEETWCSHTWAIFGTALFTSPLSLTHTQLGLHNKLDWSALFSLFPASYWRPDSVRA